MNILEENNKTGMVVQGTSTAVLTPYFHAIYVAMIPWLLPAIPFILLDIKYGRLAAKSRGEKVSVFKTIRMTINKVFTYICWIMLSSTLSIAFEASAVKFGIMCIIYGLEVMGLMKKYLLAHGIEVSDARIFTVFVRFLWHKFTSMEEDFVDIFKEVNSRRIRNEDNKDTVN